MPNENSFLDPEKMRKTCVTHTPTNSGIIHPVYEMCAMIQCHNTNHRQQKKQKRPTCYLTDAYQSIRQMPINVKLMKCTELSETGRKWLRRPKDTGFSYAEESICDILSVSHVDHHGAQLNLKNDNGNEKC